MWEVRERRVVATAEQRACPTAMAWHQCGCQTLRRVPPAPSPQPDALSWQIEAPRQQPAQPQPQPSLLLLLLLRNIAADHVSTAAATSAAAHAQAARQRERRLRGGNRRVKPTQRARRARRGRRGAVGGEAGALRRLGGENLGGEYLDDDLEPQLAQRQRDARLLGPRRARVPHHQTAHATRATRATAHATAADADAVGDAAADAIGDAVADAATRRGGGVAAVDIHRILDAAARHRHATGRDAATAAVAANQPKVHRVVQPNQHVAQLLRGRGAEPGIGRGGHAGRRGGGGGGGGGVASGDERKRRRQVGP